MPISVPSVFGRNGSFHLAARERIRCSAPRLRGELRHLSPKAHDAFEGGGKVDAAITTAAALFSGATGRVPTVYSRSMDDESARPYRFGVDDAALRRGLEALARRPMTSTRTRSSAARAGAARSPSKDAGSKSPSHSTTRGWGLSRSRRRAAASRHSHMRNWSTTTAAKVVKTTRAPPPTPPSMPGAPSIAVRRAPGMRSCGRRSGTATDRCGRSPCCSAQAPSRSRIFTQQERSRQSTHRHVALTVPCRGPRVVRESVQPSRPNDAP